MMADSETVTGVEQPQVGNSRSLAGHWGGVRSPLCNEYMNAKMTDTMNTVVVFLAVFTCLHYIYIWVLLQCWS